MILWNGKWWTLGYVTILWEHGLRRGVTVWLWCLKLSHIERVCWSKYGRWRGRVCKWLRRWNWMVMAVLEGRWHGWRWRGRGRKMRIDRFIERVWYYRGRGDKELFHHPFILFHVVIELCHALWGWYVPAYKTGGASACHRCITGLGIFQTSGMAATGSRGGTSEERLSELGLWYIGFQADDWIESRAYL